MAVAASIGGATPNFDGLYSEISRLARKLSVPSPREFNNPGETLKLQITTDFNGQNESVELFDTYIKAYYAKEGDQPVYRLFYKNSSNTEIMISDGTTTQGTVGTANVPPNNGDTVYTLNGTYLQTGRRLAMDPTTGRITYDAADTPANLTDDISLGLMKLDAVSGLNVGLINERISQVNLVIEALSKVLLVGTGNADKGIELRL